MKFTHASAQRGILFVVLASAPLLVPAAAWASYYVSDQGSSSASAGSTYPDDPGNSAGRDGVAGSDSHNFGGIGNLVQTSVTGSTSSSTDGTAYQARARTFLAQSAGGNVEDTAQIGALHSTISAYANTGLPTENINNGLASANSQDQLAWSDTVHFTSANPAGSNFTVALGLDCPITVGGIFDQFDPANFAGVAQANLSISGNIDLSQYFQPMFFIRTVESLNADGTSSPSTTVGSQGTSFTFFVPYHGSINLTFLGTLQTSAYASGGDGQTLVDAANTALFAISSPDPEASYTSDSGTVYATSLEVPEPASAAATALLAALALARRRNPK